MQTTGSTITFFSLLAVLIFVDVGATQPVEYDLGGASRPKPIMSLRAGKSYKRVHQTALRFILQGKLMETEVFLKQFLSNNPDDAETMYMLGILYGQKGDVSQAEHYLEKAIEAGLPDDRLIAGPRKVFEPLNELRLMRSLQKAYQHRLVHGPLLGAVTDKSASFWLRTSKESEIQVVLFDEQGKERMGKSNSSAAVDFTTVVKVDGLQPNTRYRYFVVVDGQRCSKSGEKTFRTFPKRGHPCRFNIAFGGGAGYVPQNERMWDTIGRFDPDALLLLGDNVYIDDPESVEMQQYTYQRRQSRPEWRKLTSRTSVFTIWDDHDFSTNDSWGGADNGIPFWKRELVFPIFRQNWANPAYAGGDEQPGCWYSFQIGDVDFIMLDCRYYRTRPKDNPNSMLGPAQLQWLKKQLLAAKGKFIVLCSSVPWDYRTKGGSLDTWNGYRQERETIFEFIETEKIGGVLLMSADRHRSDAWKIKRPNGYDFLEFNSSRLTNQHVHPTMKKKGAIFSYNELQSFGLVTFDTTIEDPSVTYEIVNINGDKPHALTVTRSELSAD